LPNLDVAREIRIRVLGEPDYDSAVTVMRRALFDIPVGRFPAHPAPAARIGVGAKRCESFVSREACNQ
jgi:hypothetical protein